MYVGLEYFVEIAQKKWNKL